MRNRSLFARLLASHLIVAIGGVLVLGVVLDRLLEVRVTRDLERRLVAEAQTAQAATEGIEQPALEATIRNLGNASSTRFTVIRADGVVLADSEHDPATMENHATRPEVHAALAGRVGSAQRVSDTLGRPFLYVALPARDGRVVRAAISAAVVSDRRGEVRTVLLMSFLAVAALAIILAVIASRGVSRPLSDVAHALGNLGAGGSIALSESGPSEIRQVARALNAMAAELATRIEELRTETGLREQILSSMAEGVVLAEPSGLVVYANPSAVEFLGSTPTLPAEVAVPGMHDIAIHHPQRRDLRAISVQLDDGRALVALQDVTESRRVESMRRDFVADASHEMKTPVAAILATAETLEQAVRDDPEAAYRFASTLVTEARRLSDLVGDLLDLARFEKGGSERGIVALSDVVRGECAVAEPRAARKGLALEAEVPDGVYVAGDRDDLALAVRNLIDNAVRYTEQGTVNVRLSMTNGAADLSVIDTGVGIPTKDLPRIFERFYRVDKARSRETGGTGLGLSIVRHIVESSGGSLRATSELGRGSRFVMSLPLESSN